MSHSCFERLLGIVIVFGFVIYFASKYEIFFIFAAIIAVSVFILYKFSKYKDRQKNTQDFEKKETFYDTMKSHAKKD